MFTFARAPQLPFGPASKASSVHQPAGLASLALAATSPQPLHFPYYFPFVCPVRLAIPASSIIIVSVPVSISILLTEVLTRHHRRCHRRLRLPIRRLTVPRRAILVCVPSHHETNILHHLVATAASIMSGLPYLQKLRKSDLTEFAETSKLRE